MSCFKLVWKGAQRRCENNTEHSDSEMCLRYSQAGDEHGDPCQPGCHTGMHLGCQQRGDSAQAEARGARKGKEQILESQGSWISEERDSETGS